MSLCCPPKSKPRRSHNWDADNSLPPPNSTCSAILSTASKTRQAGFNSSRCCERKARLTVGPTCILPAVNLYSPESARISVVLPEPLKPTIAIRSPGAIFQSSESIKVFSPIVNRTLCNSITLLPNRLVAKFNNSA